MAARMSKIELVIQTKTAQAECGLVGGNSAKYCRGFSFFRSNE
jgi:hypothetical protein